MLTGFEGGCTITRSGVGSLNWGSESRGPDIDISELESLFSIVVPPSGKGGPGGKINPRSPVVNKLEKV
ncbi:hypothetical protein AgCh_012843 [Apium graveolens]